MLKIEKKSSRSTKWEMNARAAAEEAASQCDRLDEAQRYFTSILTGRKRESVGHISDSYTALIEGNELNIYHTPAGSPKRLIAVIRKEVAHA